MAERSLAGTRIRKRRLDLGLKQASLAQSVGISPAYLNLIEHNKRRIAGKLLSDLARQLQVDSRVLREGAGAALLAALHDAAKTRADPAPALETAHEFAVRLPGWAALLAEVHQQNRAMAHRVETLADRLAHDPLLSESLYALLSSVTAIRSMASILADSGDLDPAWQARFQRNLNEDARKLAEEAHTLVAYLDGAGDAKATLVSPQEEVEAFFAARNWYLPSLEALPEAAAARRIETLVAQESGLGNRASRGLARSWLLRFAGDARVLPREDFQAARQALGPDPAALAQRFGCDMASVMRRLACLPDAGHDDVGHNDAGHDDAGHDDTGHDDTGHDDTGHDDVGGDMASDAAAEVGLVICDGTGAIIFRKPLTRFAPPRFGSACVLWPLYQALTQVMRPLHMALAMPGPVPVHFDSFTIAQPRLQSSFDAPQIIESTMLILPTGPKLAPARMPVPSFSARKIGASCRTCPREACAARREASIFETRAR